MLRCCYYLIMQWIRIIALTLLVNLSSCALFHEDMTEVDAYISNSQYSEAIIKLSEMDSKFSKKKNSEVHVLYGVQILKNLKQDKKARYVSAKEIFEKAVNLDPKNTEARTYYLMMLNLSKNV